MEIQPQNATDLYSRITDSKVFKMGMILFLTLVLLIPSVWVQNLIEERQNRQEEVIGDIAEKWSGSQLIQGPVMVLPYQTQVLQKDDNGKSNYVKQLTHIYILPEQLNIQAKVSPERLKRGIFEAAVYQSKMQLKGKFSALELTKSGINPENILWDKVQVVIGISDLKGLKNNPQITLGAHKYDFEPDFQALKLFEHNLLVQADLQQDKNTALNFNFDLDLKGSTELNFLPLGRQTSINMSGDWQMPSYTGRQLPETRAQSGLGFNANWNIPHYNRPYPQQWMAENSTLYVQPKLVHELQNEKASTQELPYIGVKFLLGVDHYQKTMRTAKYAFLIILLSFIALFFTELLFRRKVQFMQYVLIGAAMSIYYTLLLGFSEKIGFNLAYIIASAATIVLLISFLAALFKSTKPALMFGGIITLFYGFIFVIIQLQDMALLVGSIGLFVIVAILMYLSTKLTEENPQQ